MEIRGFAYKQKVKSIYSTVFKHGDRSGADARWRCPSPVSELIPDLDIPDTGYNRTFWTEFSIA